MLVGLENKLKKNSTPFFTSIKITLAGIFAFLLVFYFKLPESVWCLVTIAAVTQVGLDQTLTKSLMRIIGTLLGSVMGFGVAWVAGGNPYLIISLVFIVIYFTSMIALQPTIYSYASIICGITVAIIVFFSIENQNFAIMARDRAIEVLLGIFILGCINSILFAVVKYYAPQKISYTPVSWHHPTFSLYSKYSIPSLKISLACIGTFLIGYVFKLPQGYWATITCLLIMEEHHAHTVKKAFLRFLSHVIAAGIGFVFIVFLINEPYVWRLIPLIITFFLCGWLIGSKTPYANMGNTLAIAVSIMLLTSPYMHETAYMILTRLFNVILGISVAYAVLFLPDFLMMRFKSKK